MATATPMLPLTTPVAVTALAPGERWNLPVPESDGRPGTSAGSNTDSGSAVAPAPHDSTVVPATASAAPDATPGGGERQAARDAAGEGEVSEEEADDLQELDEEDRQLLQAARRRDEEDAGMRERVAENVEGLMDNGVRMNPWLGAYCRTGGGSGGGSQAAVQQQPPLAQRGAAVGAAGRGRPLELSGLHLAAAAHRSWIDDELWEGAAEEGWTVDDDGSGGHHRYVSPTGHPFTSKRAALAVGGVGPDGRLDRRLGAWGRTGGGSGGGGSQAAVQQQPPLAQHRAAAVGPLELSGLQHDAPADGVALWQLHALHDAISDGKLPRLLRPGAGASDHAAGIRSGFLNWYPGLRLMGCYPHVSWHFTHSKLAVKRAHPSFGFIKEVLVELHTCHTVCNVLQSKYACVYLPFPSMFTSVFLTYLPRVYLSNTSIFTSCLPTCRSRYTASLPVHTSLAQTGMWDVLVDVLRGVWGNKDEAINGLWNSIMVAPNNQWHLGVTQVPGATPSQQTQESWHHSGIMLRVADSLNASTETVLEKSLNNVMALDGVCNPPTENSDPFTCHLPRIYLSYTLLVTSQIPHRYLSFTVHLPLIYLMFTSRGLRGGGDHHHHSLSAHLVTSQVLLVAQSCSSPFQSRALMCGGSRVHVPSSQSRTRASTSAPRSGRPRGTPYSMCSPRVRPSTRRSAGTSSNGVQDIPFVYPMLTSWHACLLPILYLHTTSCLPLVYLLFTSCLPISFHTWRHIHLAAAWQVRGAARRQIEGEEMQSRLGTGAGHQEQHVQGRARDAGSRPTVRRQPVPPRLPCVQVLRARRHLQARAGGHAPHRG